jgi:hypothetical protein
VPQSSWNGNPANGHKPHNYERNIVTYTGTHGNNTVVGWWRGEATPRARREALAYMGGCRGAVNWCFIQLLFSTVADVAVVPIQDALAPAPRPGSTSRRRAEATGGGGSTPSRPHLRQKAQTPGETLREINT